MTVGLGVFLGPFLALILIAFVARPLSILIGRLLPGGRLKRALFKRIS